MTVYSVATIGGSRVENAYNMSVNKSTSNNNATTTFSIELDNYNGNISGTYTVGDEVIIYADNNAIMPGSTPTMQFKLNTSGNSIVDDIGGLIGSAFDSGNITWVGGKIGSATQYNLGGHHFVMSGAPVFTSGQSFSVMAWVQYSGAIQTGAARGIIGKGALSSCNYALDVASGALPIFRFGNRSGTSSSVVNSSGMAPEQWIHVAGVFHAGSYKHQIFINGQPGSETTVASGFNTITTGSLSIGRLGIINGNTDSGAQLKIDDIRIYSQALTPSEIYSIYNYGSGNEVRNNGSQVIFKGILENREYTGEPQEELVTLEGRDYTARLMDRTVEPTTYTNLEAGSVVKHIINTYVNDLGTQITVNNVDNSAIIIPRITFKHTPVYDAVKRLSELAGFIFYIDNDKDLHFEEASTTSTGFTFDSGNTLDANFAEQRDTVYNQIWVYGDRYLDRYRETFTAGSPLGGSIFNLLYNPHNTSVTVSGAVIQPGGIANFSLTAESGVKYLVNYDDKKIIFVSGTNNGANIPTSGNQVIIEYQRLLPIVKVGDSDSSIDTYGKRIKVIVDKSIKDPQTAETILSKELEENKDPRKEGSLEIKGVYNVIPSQTCIVNLPNHNVSNKTYEILEANYVFNKSRNLSENNLDLKVNKKLTDLSDSIKDVLLQLRRLNAQDIDEGDLLTRFKFSTGSFGIRQSGTVVSVMPDINDSFVVGHPHNGQMGNVGNKLMYWNFDASGTWTTDVITNISGEMINGVIISGVKHIDFGSSFLGTGSNGYARFVYPGSFFHQGGSVWTPGSAILAASGPGQDFGWSINAWVNIRGSGLGPSGNFHTIIGNRVGDNFAFQVQQQTTSNEWDNGSFVLLVRTDDSLLTSDWINHSGTAQWSNVGFSWKLNSRPADTGSPWYPYVETYFNGSLITAGSYRFATGNPYAINGTGSMYIGMDDRQKHAINGLIANLCIYPRFISGAEHLALFNKQGSGMQPLLGDRRSAFEVQWSGNYP